MKTLIRPLQNLDFVFSLAIQMWTCWCVFWIIVLLEHELKADIPLQDFMVSILGSCPGPEVAPDRDTTTTVFECCYDGFFLGGLIQ